MRSLLIFRTERRVGVQVRRLAIALALTMIAAAPAAADGPEVPESLPFLGPAVVGCTFRNCLSGTDHPWEFRRALADLSVSDAEGPFVVRFSRDLTLSGAQVTYSGDELLLLLGGGHVLTSGRDHRALFSRGPLEVNHCSCSPVDGTVGSAGRSARSTG